MSEAQETEIKAVDIVRLIDEANESYWDTYPNEAVEELTEEQEKFINEKYLDLANRIIKNLKS